MKSALTIGIAALVAALVGAGYAEYDRVIVKGAETQNRIFQVTRAHILDTRSVKEATALGVGACMREIHFSELPPALTAFVRDYAIIEYDLTKKYGTSALEHADELIDMRNALSALSQGDVSSEIEELDKTTLKKVLSVMRAFNNNPRPTLTCIHNRVYETLAQNGNLPI